MAAPISQIQSVAVLETAITGIAAGSKSPFVGLQPGAVVAARVLALLESGQVQLAIGNALVEATTQVPLSPGATVRLAVQNTGSGTTLQLLDPAVPSASTPSASAPSALTAPALTPPGVAAPAVAAPPVQIAITTPPAKGAVSTLALAPAGSMGAGPSPAPASTTPVAIPSAPPEAPISAQRVTAPDLPLAVAPELVPAPAIEATAALEAAVRTAAVIQGSLSPLYAEIAAAVDVPTLPEPVRREALRLLSLRPALDDNFAAEDLKQALANSGLFLEARISEEAQPSTPELPSPETVAAPNAAFMATTANVLPAGDLKAALIVFRQVLATALTGGEEVQTIPAAETARVPTPAQGGMPASSAGQSAFSESPVSAPSTPMQRTAPAAPPPPFRDGPVTAQPPVTATIDATTPPHVAVQTLMAMTDGALARQTLLQAASLPGAPSSHQDGGGPRWNFEIPFAIPVGTHVVTNVAQFEISRDGRAATRADGQGPVWRARFSVDVAPIGRVHAQIGLRGVRAAVTLWAESPEGVTRLRAGAAKLADALRAAELDPGDLVVRDGAPRARAVPAGHFLDRAS